MLNTTICPGCHTRYQVAEVLRGQRFRCRNSVCKRVFLVRTEEPPPTSTPMTPSRPSSRSTSQNQQSGLVGDMIPILPSEEATAPLPFPAPTGNKKAGQPGDINPQLDAGAVGLPNEPDTTVNYERAAVAPTNFHCPNPVCDQVFSIDAIKGASHLICPRCRRVFQLRNTAPTTSLPGPPSRPIPQPTGVATSPPAAKVAKPTVPPPTQPPAPPHAVPTAKRAVPPPLPGQAPTAPATVTPPTLTGTAAPAAPPPLPFEPREIGPNSWEPPPEQWSADGASATPAAAATSSDTSSLGKPQQPPHQQRFPRPGLILGSVLWVCFAWNLALLSPWLGLAPSLLAEPIHLVAPLVTAVLIGCNLVVCIRQIGRTGKAHTALPTTLTLLLLFTCLFFQIACHQGAHHFYLETGPKWWDWLGFSAAHAVRAADVLDILHAYGLEIQVIRHRSLLVASCLIAFQLTVNLFVLTLLAEGVQLLRRPRKQRYQSANVARSRNLPFSDEDPSRNLAWFLVVIGFIILWLATALFAGPWSVWDTVVWPFDNFLRLLDCADVMELCQVRLHEVPQAVWEGTLTVTCRLLLALALGNWVARSYLSFSLRYLGGFGLTQTHLEKYLEQCENEKLREQITGRIKAFSNSRIEEPPAWNWSRTLVVSGVAVIALLMGLCFFSQEAAIRQLTYAATGRDNAAALRALTALRRLGPGAASVIPILAKSDAQTIPERRIAYLNTLEYFGPAAAKVLIRELQNDPDQAGLAVLASLRRIGPQAAPQLVEALKVSVKAVQDEARATLKDLGRDAVQPLMDATTENNYPAFLEWIQRLDPKWHQRSCRSVYLQTILEDKDLVDRCLGTKGALTAQEAARLRSLGPKAGPVVVLLRNRLSSPTKDLNVITALGTIGPASEIAVPQLMELLDKEPVTRREVVNALAEIGPVAAKAVPRLLLCLDDNSDDSIRRAAVKALGKLGEASLVVPQLIERLWNPVRKERVFAIVALGDLGPEAGRAIPALCECLRDQSDEVKNSARQALDRINPNWRSLPLRDREGK